MGPAREQHLVGTGGERHATRQHLVEEAPVQRLVGLLGVIEVAGVAGREAQPDQRGDHRHLGDDAGGSEGVAQAGTEVAGAGEQLDVDVIGEEVERGEPGGGGQRVARERAGVEHRPER